MDILNITNDYDNITSGNYTDHDNMTLTNCTNNENNIEIIIPLFAIIPSGMSLICLISLTVYTLIKPLLSKKQYPRKICFNKWWINIYTQNILLDVS